MTDVRTTAPSETELEEAGSRRLLAAVDEIRQLDEEIEKNGRTS